jgi:hypothetical protein
MNYYRYCSFGSRGTVEQGGICAASTFLSTHNLLNFLNLSGWYSIICGVEEMPLSKFKLN